MALRGRPGKFSDVQRGPADHRAVQGCPGGCHDLTDLVPTRSRRHFAASQAPERAPGREYDTCEPHSTEFRTNLKPHYRRVQQSYYRVTDNTLGDSYVSAEPVGKPRT